MTADGRKSGAVCTGGSIWNSKSESESTGAADEGSAVPATDGAAVAAADDGGAERARGSRGAVAGAVAGGAAMGEGEAWLESGAGGKNMVLRLRRSSMPGEGMAPAAGAPAAPSRAASTSIGAVALGEGDAMGPETLGAGTEGSGPCAAERAPMGAPNGIGPGEKAEVRWMERCWYQACCRRVACGLRSGVSEQGWRERPSERLGFGPAVWPPGPCGLETPGKSRRTTNIEYWGCVLIQGNVDGAYGKARGFLELTS